jgi:hypothetical protein
MTEVIRKFCMSEKEVIRKFCISEKEVVRKHCISEEVTTSEPTIFSNNL